MKIEYKANVTGDKKIELNIIRPQDFSADIVAMELTLNRLFRMQQQSELANQQNTDMYKERQRVINYLRSLRNEIEKVLVNDYLAKTKEVKDEPVMNVSKGEGKTSETEPAPLKVESKDNEA